MSHRYDPLSPPFISFLARTVKEARASGKPLGYCGEQAADPLMALALLGIGIEALSVPASSIGPIKAMVRSVKFSELRDEVSRLVNSGTTSMRAELADWVRERGIALAQ